jgi:hypothetical protein
VFEQRPPDLFLLGWEPTGAGMSIQQEFESGALVAV